MPSWWVFLCILGAYDVSIGVRQLLFGPDFGANTPTQWIISGLVTIGLTLFVRLGQRLFTRDRAIR